MGEYQKAIADYAEAIRLDPNFPKAYNNRGAAYLDLGEYEDAIADHTEALRIDRNYYPAYHGRGLAYHDLGDYEQAIADFESYLGLAPPDDEPRRARAQRLIDEMRGEQ